MPDCSVDSVVCDPPYGLSKEPDMVEVLRHWLAGDDYTHKGAGFMGKSWDSFVPGPSIWRECYRVLKPGGHLVAFAGSRTYDLMGVAIRIAGFEIRDGLQWAYGSGFPKSLDVGKAVDKIDAAEERLARAREFQGWLRQYLTPKQVDEATGTVMGAHLTTHPTQPAVATAELFDRLRPLLPEVPARIEALVAQRTVESEAFKRRKVLGSRDVPVGHSFAGATYGGDSSSRPFNDTAPATPEAERWAGWGTALKPSVEPIVLARRPLQGTVAGNVLAWGTGGINVDACRVGSTVETWPKTRKCGGERGDDASAVAMTPTAGGAVLAQATGDAPAGRWPSNFVLSHAATPDGYDACEDGCVDGCPVRELDGQEGVASRFFPTFRYQAKAGRKERPVVDGIAHNTVKPLKLMSWLCKLVTPPGGTVLDPFAGSGTTGEAALLEGFTPVLIEREPDYLPLIDARLGRARAQFAARTPAEPDLFSCADE